MVCNAIQYCKNSSSVSIINLFQLLEWWIILEAKSLGAAKGSYFKLGVGGMWMVQTDLCYSASSNL